jgi:hypothetical protein
VVNDELRNTENPQQIQASLAITSSKGANILSCRSVVTEERTVIVNREELSYFPELQITKLYDTTIMVLKYVPVTYERENGSTMTKYLLQVESPRPGIGGHILLTEYVTLYTRCRINRYNRVRLLYYTTNEKSNCQFVVCNTDIIL